MTDRPVAVVSTTISRTVDQFYREITQTLQAQGYEVHVVTSPGPEVPGLRDRADRVHIVPMARNVSPLADLRALLGWLRVLREIRPDVVLAGTPKAALLGMVSSRILRVPRRAYFLQGLRLEGISSARQRAVLSAMERLTSWCGQVVIAVSPSLADRYRALRLHSGRPLVVPHHGSSHGVNTDYFTPSSRAEGLLEDSGLDPSIPVLTFIGRLTRDKGPDALIAAASALHALGDRVQLLIVGAQDESDSAAYLKRLRQSGLPVAVFDHLADVRPYLSVTDIVVLPTWREGMPNAILEAAAMGIPAITTDATGAVDAVVHGLTGLVVPVNDSRALADAIDRLLKDPNLRRTMGEAARSRVVADFQPDDVAGAVVGAALGTVPNVTTVRSLPGRSVR